MSEKQVDELTAARALMAKDKETRENAVRDALPALLGEHRCILTARSGEPRVDAAGNIYIGAPVPVIRALD